MTENKSIYSNWFDDPDDGGPRLTAEMIQAAEAKLGYRLPSVYKALLSVQNGGTPRLCCFPTNEPTGWADDHVEIDVIFGIGGEEGIDAECGSCYLIEEWEYPNVGVVIGMTPSAGHEAIMLDYSLCGPAGEPRVIYVDVETDDGKPHIVALAPNLATFLHGVVDSSAFEDE